MAFESLSSIKSRMFLKPLTFSSDTTQLSVHRSTLSHDIAHLENFQSYTGGASLSVDDDSYIEQPIFSTKHFEDDN